MRLTFELLASLIIQPMLGGVAPVHGKETKSCQKDYTVWSTGNMLDNLRRSWESDDDIEKDARQLAVALSTAGKDKALDNIIKDVTLSVCDLPKHVPINLYQFNDGRPESSTTKVEITADMLGEYDLDTRIWPVILHAAVIAVRKEPSILLRDERDIFECNDHTKALCNLGSYISTMTGELIVATRLNSDESIDVWKPIMQHAGGSDLVSLWSTSGNRRIIKNFTEKAGDDSSFFYYNTDPDEVYIHGSLTIEEVRKEDAYILYPNSMRKYL